MSSGVGIVIVIMVGLALAGVIHARAIARLKPVIEAAARKHRAQVHQSFPGMPQITKLHRGHVLRLTPMTLSTASPEGGGEMTCVDFEWLAPGMGEFRVREKSEARRNTVPVALMGGDRPFPLGDPGLDERFHATGTNTAAALRVLGRAGVFESIESLPRGADIHIRGGRCSVTVKGYPSTVEEVDRLFALSELLLEASMDASGTP